jgi:hypothetical protein
MASSIFITQKGVRKKERTSAKDHKAIKDPPFFNCGRKNMQNLGWRTSISSFHLEVVQLHNKSDAQIPSEISREIFSSDYEQGSEIWLIGARSGTGYNGHESRTVLNCAKSGAIISC